jgi:hypothetical protein
MRYTPGTSDKGLGWLFIACLAEDEKKTGQAFEELLEVDSQLDCRLDQ